MFRNLPDFLIPIERNPYTPEMKEAVMRILDRGSTMSMRMQEQLFFEKEFAEFCGTKYAVSCWNAIHLTATAAGIGPGDEVIVPANSYPTVAQGIEYMGGKAVFVDVEEDTFNMDPNKIEEKITDRTKIIWPVHSHGHPANMGPIMEIAEKHGVRVFENMAHAVGAKYEGKRVPVSEAGTTCLRLKSLWLPTGGDMTVTNNKELADATRIRYYHGYSGYGGERQENCQVLSLVFMMSDIDAAVGRIQLRSLQEYVDLQRKHAQILTELLEDTPVITPVEKDYAYHTFLRFVIRAPKRDQLMEFLQRQGIGCLIHYPLPIYRHTYSRALYGDIYKERDFPVTEKLKKEELSLPEPRFRTQWELEFIAKKIREFYS